MIKRDNLLKSQLLLLGDGGILANRFEYACLLKHLIKCELIIEDLFFGFFGSYLYFFIKLFIRFNSVFQLVYFLFELILLILHTPNAKLQPT